MTCADNTTQRVTLSETYTDDLYYASTALVTRVEVSFNQDVAVFVRLSNAPDTPTVTLPLVRDELDTFLDVYLPYLREQEGERPPLDASRFAAWLAERSARVVGWAHLASTHPLACWLTVVHEEPYWVDTDNYHATLGDVKPPPLLPWMSAFVTQLSERHADDAVTGAQALEVLSLVQAEMLTAALDEVNDQDEHPF